MSKSPKTTSGNPKMGRGRKRQFDSDKVLRDAMMVFWRKGYAATSYADLVRETGVQRYGLYQVLGDKEAAFHKVLDHYVGRMVTDLTAPLRAPDAGLNEIYAYFNTINNFNVEQPIGCMVCNAIASDQGQHQIVAQLSKKMLLMVKDSLNNALAGAINKGELQPTTDTDVLAQTLLGTMIGASTLFRSPLGHETASVFIKENLKILDKYKASIQPPAPLPFN